jgi:hypothetical protein
MALLGKFDINSDFTQFYLWGLIIFMIFTVLLSWVSPKGKQKVRGRATKIDERYTSVEGELID